MSADPNCIFCKIAKREIPSHIVHDDADTFAFMDIRPIQPGHLLVIPKRLIVRIGAAEPADQALLGHLLLVAGTVARKLNLGSGFRLVINHGPHGGESVPHLHVHLLAGRPLAWPPG